ncbi:MAG: hypothetical protein DWP97_10090 [Calditrichaeota bacterium]|nr:MAG: hypothetical protein DWP97_10090 [Calditrichota bacterium]
MKKGLLLVAAMLFIIPLTVDAGCGSCGSEKPGHTHEEGHSHDAMKANVKTIEGTLVCLGCSLKADGAKSECKVNGCSHAVKTADGKYINLLNNKYSKGLIKGGDMHNKPIKITGTYFANAQTLDVQSFTFDGKTKSWCDHCSAMDGCMAKK